jgi:hypothetical protein
VAAGGSAGGQAAATIEQILSSTEIVVRKAPDARVKITGGSLM